MKKKVRDVEKIPQILKCANYEFNKNPKGQVIQL